MPLRRIWVVLDPMLRVLFLPFLYDEAASKIREANNKFLGEDVDAYEPS